MPSMGPVNMEKIYCLFTNMVISMRGFTMPPRLEPERYLLKVGQGQISIYFWTRFAPYCSLVSYIEFNVAFSYRGMLAIDLRR